MNDNDKNFATSTVTPLLDPAQPPPAAAHAFVRTNVVRHVKSGGIYVIVLEPDLLKLEASAEPAYGYRSVASDGSLTGPLWARSQTEMEDGRFVLVGDDVGRSREVLGFGNAAGSENGAPDLGAMLKLSRSRYEATYTSADGRRTASWDCTGHLCANYPLAEFWEIVEGGSFLADTLREDESCPEWVQDAEQGDGVVTVRAMT